MMRIMTTYGMRRTAVWTAVLVVMFGITGFSAPGDGTRSVPARAVELVGTVLANYAGEEHWRDLFRMEGVRDGDCIFTGPDGEVTLKCKDNTIVTLFARGEMRIEELSRMVLDGKNTAVTALTLFRGGVDINTGVSGRYQSDLILTVSGARIESSGNGERFRVMVEYVPDTEAIDVIWYGGEGTVTLPVEYPGVIEVTFGESSMGSVSFSRDMFSDSGLGELRMKVAVRPMDASIDAVIDRITIRDGGRIALSGRTVGSGVVIFTEDEGTIPVDSKDGFWAMELMIDAGESWSPGPSTVGVRGGLPDIPSGEENIEAVREDGKCFDESNDGEPGSQVDERDASRVARSFLEDFIGVIEKGDVAALSGLIDPSYSGIGVTRSGLVDLVREYFDDADTLRITWSVVRIDKTEDGIIATISWSSSAGTSGVSTFWLSDMRMTRLSHAEGDWFF